MSVGKRRRTGRDGQIIVVWVVRYYDQDGKYRQGGTFERKRDAEARDREIRNELDQGNHRPDRDSITVSQAAELWLDRARADRLEPITIKGYESLIEFHINGATVPADVPNGWQGNLGDVKLSKLTTPTCVAFQRQIPKTLARRRNGQLIPGKLISKRTCGLILTIFKAILNEAQLRGLVGNNPARQLKMKTNDRDKIPLRIGHEIPDREEVRRILTTSSGIWLVLFTVAAFTGMRASELRGLIWDNVDLDRSVIHVWQRADTKRRIGPCKSGSGYRDLYIPPFVVDALREWKKICPASPLGLVFPRWDGEVLWHAEILIEGWYPVQQQIGMTRPRSFQVASTARRDRLAKYDHKYNFHALRHFYASLMIDQGIAPKRLQALLGHMTLAMTMDLYGHLFPMRKDEAIQMNEAIASVLSPSEA